MPDENSESCGGCDRVFGTRIDHIEGQLREVKALLHQVNDRERENTADLKTKIAVAENNIKWWGTIGGALGGFGVEIISKFLK